ncbi:MAG: hypothetical protein JW771_03205, partial [Candidatus Thermoplasmatota archaeon]|nr:hypothetical protein [Candidatus Thermoplasmatota archaeon]
MSIKAIKDAEKKALDSIEKARQEASLLLEHAHKTAEKERQKHLQNAQKKVLQFEKKAQADAAKEIAIIKKKTITDIANLKKGAGKNIANAVELIIAEIEKGE